MLKTSARLSRCCAAGLAGLLLMLNAAALAGSLDAPAAPTAAGSAMFTLQDLCNRLTSGTAGTQRGGAFAEPAAGPAATMCTLNQIMSAMPTADTANGAGVADVLAGKTFWGLLTGGGWGLKTGTATAGASFTGGDGVKVIPIPDGLYSGGKTATASDSNLLAANIKTGVSLFGTAGSFTADGDAVAGDVLSGKKAYVAGNLVTGTATAGANVTGTDGSLSMTIPDGLYSGSKTATAADTDLTAANIKSGITIFGVAGNTNVVDTSSGDAVAADLATGKKAWVDGAEITGTATVAPPCTCSGTLNGTRWCDNGNGTVTDLLGSTVNSRVHGQCLVWLQNASCSANLVSINNAGTGLNWLNAVIWSSAVKSTVCGLTDNSVEGDWRLPTITELHALTTGTEAVLSGTMRAFTGVNSNAYWSSTTRFDNPLSAWYVFPDDGRDATDLKTYTQRVWPVRGGL